MKILIFTLCTFLSFSLIASEKKKVIYKYKKYEKFDFEKMSIEGLLLLMQELEHPMKYFDS